MKVVAAGILCSALGACSTVRAEARPGLLDSGTATALAADTRVSITTERPTATSLVVTLQVVATGSTPVEDIFPNILMSFDGAPNESTAQMDEEQNTITVKQTVTGNTDRIHEVTVTDERSGKAVRWKAS